MVNKSIQEIAEKWNIKYRSDKRFLDPPIRNVIIENSFLLPQNGWVLEIAGGNGATADYLSKLGLKVIEVDISHEALKMSRKRNNQVMQVLADAEHLPIQQFKFDVICNFYFLERSIFPFIKKNLKPGGLLFYETMTIEMLSLRPEIPEKNLLLQNELKEAFQSFEILQYFEGWVDSDHGRKKSIARMIARKPLVSV